VKDVAQCVTATILNEYRQRNGRSQRADVLLKKTANASTPSVVSGAKQAMANVLQDSQQRRACEQNFPINRLCPRAISGSSEKE